jgi:hypothetical protein
MTLYIKLCAEIFTYDVENVFEVLNNHHQKLTLNHPVVIQKQRAREGAEEPQSEPNERAVMVLILTEGRGLVEVVLGHRLKRATTGQGIVRMLTGYEEILKKKERSFCRQISVPVYSKSSLGNRAWPLLLLNTGGDDPDDPHAVQKEVPFFKVSFAFVNFVRV